MTKTAFDVSVSGIIYVSCFCILFRENKLMKYNCKKIDDVSIVFKTVAFQNSRSHRETSLKLFKSNFSHQVYKFVCLYGRLQGRKQLLYVLETLWEENKGSTNYSLD